MKRMEADIYSQTAIPEKFFKNDSPSSATEASFAWNNALPKMQKMVGTCFGGTRITESIFCVTRQQYRFPRSNKKRMQKKWRKDQRNWNEQPAMYMVGGKDIVAHPEIVRKLQHQLDIQLNERMASVFK